MAPRQYWVYIMASKSRVLYAGVTNDLVARVYTHKSGVPGSFTARYHVTRLVYSEVTTDVRAAIEAEKRIKGWSRAKKVALIESANPEWKDLSESWDDDASTLTGCQPSSPRRYPPSTCHAEP